MVIAHTKENSNRVKKLFSLLSMLVTFTLVTTVRASYKPGKVNVCSEAKEVPLLYKGVPYGASYVFLGCIQGTVRIRYHGMTTVGSLPGPFIEFGKSGDRYLDTRTKVYILKNNKYLFTFDGNDLSGFLGYSERVGYGQYRLVVSQYSHTVGSVTLITSRY